MAMTKLTVSFYQFDEKKLLLEPHTCRENIFKDSWFNVYVQSDPSVLHYIKNEGYFFRVSFLFEMSSV